MIPAKEELSKYDKEHPDRLTIEKRLKDEHERHLIIGKDHIELTKLSEDMIKVAPTMAFSHGETQEAEVLGSRILGVDLLAAKQSVINSIKARRAARLSHKQ